MAEKLISSIQIEDDETLQQMLTLMKFIPKAITIGERVFCEIPTSDYDGYIDESIGDSTKLMSTVYKAENKTEETVYVLLGEDDNYGEDATGSRDFVNNPITKDELIGWVLKYGASKFHLNYPRKKVVEAIIEKEVIIEEIKKDEV